MASQSRPCPIQAACSAINSTESHEDGIRPGIEFLTDYSRQHAAELAAVLPYKSLLRVYLRSTNFATRSNIGIIFAHVASVPPTPTLRDSLSDILKVARSIQPPESPKNFQLALDIILAGEQHLRPEV
jgi:hypothetical protein